MRKLNINTKKREFHLGQSFTAYMLILPFLFFLTFMLFIPTIQGIIWSFFKMTGYTVGEFIGFDNYISVFTNSEFKSALGNNFKYLFWYLTLEFWPPIIVAVFLNETRRMKSVYQFFIYSPHIMPAIGISMLWYFMYYPNASGLLNTLLVNIGLEPVAWLQESHLTIPMIMIANTWGAMGGSMLIYLAALQGINSEIYEAALMDGAGFFTRVFKITLPNIASIVLLQLARGFIAVFRILERPLTMTGGGPNGASNTLGLLGYRYAFQSYNVGGALAINVVVFVLLVILTLFYFGLKNKVEQDA